MSNLTTDLVAKLRAEVVIPYKDGYEPIRLPPSKLRTDAADEIERLGRERARYIGVIVGYVRCVRDGVGEKALWWWELQQIANEVVEANAAAKTRPLADMLAEHEADPQKKPHLDAARAALDVRVSNAIQPCTCSAHPEPHYHDVPPLKAI